MNAQPVIAPVPVFADLDADPLARHRVIASVGPRARASVKRLERAKVGA